MDEPQKREQSPFGKRKAYHTPESITVKTIHLHSEYVSHCIHCGKRLKKVVDTDQGDYSFRCYFVEKDLPLPKGIIRVKDFPDFVFEEIAQEAISRIEETDPEQIALATIPREIILKYPILYKSWIQFSFYPLYPTKEKPSYYLSEGWNDIFIKESVLWSFTKMQPGIMDRIFCTARLKRWIGLEYGKLLTFGMSLEDFKAKNMKQKKGEITNGK